MSTQTDQSALELPQAGLDAYQSYPFLQALLGRRSRRFAQGARISQGPLTYASTERPLPLDPGEELLVLLAAGGNTGWHFAIAYGDRPVIANYSGAAGGRTAISGAGFHVSDLFFTNDDGVFFFPTRDAPALAAPSAPLPDRLAAHRARIRRLADGRLRIPREAPWLEPHNHYDVNLPGTTLIIPVADLAEHLLAIFWYFVENGYRVVDDISGQPIRGLEPFSDLFDPDIKKPLSFVETHAVAQASVELATATYAGALALGPLGLGGWSFDGIDFFGILGASGRSDYPGLGFRFDADAGWATPNVTGLPGVFEALTPPHVTDLHQAVEKLARRKYGTGGPFNRGTGGPWQDNPGVRGGAVAPDPRKQEAVATIAQHIYETHGRFPATVPAILIRNYLQVHHLDLGFYDRHFGPGAYLDSHREHLARWHPDR